MRTSFATWRSIRRTPARLFAYQARARECPVSALRHFQRSVGEPEQHLAASEISRLRGADALGLSRLLRLGAKERSHLFPGVVFGTTTTAPVVLRLANLAFERAKNTARTPDVKYHVLLPDTERSAAMSIIINGARCCGPLAPFAPIAASITTWLTSAHRRLAHDPPSMRWSSTTTSATSSPKGWRVERALWSRSDPAARP